MFFTKEAINKLNTIGSIQPSSKYLIQKCIEDIDFKENQIIVEFGSGNGNFTEKILNKIPLSTKLIAFETNKNFYNHCAKKFESNKNFKIYNLSAEQFSEVLDNKNIHSVDYIISSLPLSLLKQNVIDSLIEKILSKMNKSGCYIQYQYSLGKYKFLKGKFKSVKLNFVLRNMPPSIIYKCYLK